MTDPENRWSTDVRPPAEAERATAAQHQEIAPESVERRSNVAGLELNAIVGPGTAFTGSLSFTGKVRIEGQFEGTILGGDMLVIGDGASVSGEIRARQVVILGGRVEADIQASESIELYLPAVVTGDLKSPQIFMDRGIQFHGTCDMTADPPAVEESRARPDSEI